MLTDRFSYNRMHHLTALWDVLKAKTFPTNQTGPSGAERKLPRTLPKFIYSKWCFGGLEHSKGRAAEHKLMTTDQKSKLQLKRPTIITTTPCNKTWNMYSILMLLLWRRSSKDIHLTAIKTEQKGREDGPEINGLILMNKKAGDETWKGRG